MTSLATGGAYRGNHKVPDTRPAVVADPLEVLPAMALRSGQIPVEFLLASHAQTVVEATAMIPRTTMTEIVAANLILTVRGHGGQILQELSTRENKRLSHG